MRRKWWICFCVLASLLAIFAFAGCGKNGASGDQGAGKGKFYEVKAAGDYRGLVMQPDGKFLVRDKVKDGESVSGVIYRVEVGDDKKISKITSMYGDKVISTVWRDTKGQEYNISAVAVDYQDNGYVRYTFKNSRAGSKSGYYGAFAIRYKIDEKSKQPKVAYLYNKEGTQVGNQQGFAQMLFTYDEGGKLTKVGYANTNGDRVTTNRKEYETCFEYGKESQLPTAIGNYGKDESLSVDDTGIAKIKKTYDAQDRVTEVRHFGADESLKERKLKPYHFEEAWFDITAGAITKLTYEGDNRIPSKVAFFGKDEQPLGIKEWGNIASFTYTLTENGEAKSIASFGPDDTPVALDKNELGSNVVKLEISRDDDGNIASISTYGRDDTLVVADKLKAAQIRYKYDEKRRETEQAFFGTSEDPVEVTNKGHKYHRMTEEYNDDDELVLCVYYDKNDKEVAREQPQPDKGKTVATNTSSNSNDLNGFIAKKDAYDQQIASLASDINGYLNTHTNFVGANQLMSRGANIRSNVQAARNQLQGSNVGTAEQKNKLLAVFDAELGRVDGLLEGMRLSSKGGDYKAAFKRGTDAAYRYDDANAAFNQVR